MKKISLIFYFIIIVLFTLFSYFFIDYNLSFLKFLYTGFSLNNRLQTTGVYIFLVIVLTILYLYFIKLFSDKQISKKEVKLLIAVTVVILFFSYPAFLSYDIYNYVATAKVMFVYKENPYLIMPIEFIDEPLLDFMHAANKTALYGPIWILVTLLPLVVGFNNFIITMFAFKSIASIFYLLTTYLIFKLKQSWFSVLIFALNPLVIVETLISGHNDIVMMGLALSSLYYFKINKNFVAILLFILSIGIKFATIFLTPLIVYIIFCKYMKSSVKWNKIYNLSAILMLLIFILSPIREEMYPWYAIWFFVFICLSSFDRRVIMLSVTFMFGLMLRYIPFMLTGNYNETTINFRTFIMFIPVFIYIFLIALKDIYKARLIFKTNR